MSFASVDFLFLFLPAALTLATLAAFVNPGRLSVPVFLIVSLVFYAVSSIPHLLLLLALIVVTWASGIGYDRARKASRPRLAALCLTIGIGANLAALGVWKYGSALIAIWNGLNLTRVEDLGLILPLGISFYSLQQIGYLLDLRLGRTRPGRLMEHAAFVAFFPQLLSGPIVTHKRMQAQFDRIRQGILWPERLDMAVLGVAWLAIGLFKKAVLADSLAVRAMPLVQKMTEQGISTLEAWQIALSSGPIIYLDFSAYSDMAVGLGLLFGVRLPYNFNAPQRSSTNRQGWRRWHITFHNFVRDHIYRPLHKRWHHRAWGNFAAIFIVFSVSALWHGDGPRYVLWGLLTFCAFVLLERVTQLFPQKLQPVLNVVTRYFMFITLPLIFLTPNLDVAFGILERMVSFGGLATGGEAIAFTMLIKLALLLGLLVCLSSEISTQVLLNEDRAHPERSFFGYRPPVWSPSLPWALFIALLLFVSMFFLGQSPDFFYNQF